MKKKSSSNRKKKLRIKRRIRLAIIIVVFLAIISLIVFGIVSCVKSNQKPLPQENPTVDTNEPDNTKTDASKPEGNTPKEEPDVNKDPQEEEKKDENQTADPSAPEPEPEQPEEPQKPNSWDTSYDLSSIKPIGAVNKNSWNLILANPDNALPEGFQGTLNIKYFDSEYRVDSRMLPYLQKMFAAAKADGITLVLRSAFRTHERQWELYNERVQIYINKGYSKEEAAKIAATINAYPGTSEHETGLAVDILSKKYTSFNEGFDKTDEYKWLECNAYKFGFILRYPKDKQDIHKIIYEPWHYRFVGIENSYPIHKQNICLEEYLQKIN